MGDEREKTEQEFPSTTFSSKDDTASVDTIEKSVYSKRLIIVGCLVCIVTGVIVSAIAVPVTKNSEKSKCKDDCCAEGAALPNVNADHLKEIDAVLEKEPKVRNKRQNPVKRDPRADTPYGPVIGHEVETGIGDEWDNAMSYLGVRFAAPVGRWERPVEPENFTDPYYADHHRPMCMQGGGILFLSGQQDTWTDFDEDCLFMDIFSPMDASGGLYPVMLYFYGGAYQGGGTLQYPGQTLVHKGVVVAVINYRLGIFGYATTEQGTLKGNYGLWDQRMAMIYVQNAISAYGGDPNKVTIFGQSAGAGSIGAHIVSPLTKGLYQQALLQSGNELSFWAFNTEHNHPHTYLPQVADKVGCNSAETEADWVACMKGVDKQVLLQNNRNFDCNFCLGFVPVIDGEFVLEHPYYTLEKGEHHDVPIMIGANTGECNLYVMGEWPWMIPEAEGHNRTQHQVEVAELVDWFSYVVTEPGMTEDEVYQVLNFYYSPWGWLDDKTQNKEIIGQMCTDGAWSTNTHQMLNMRYKHNPNTPLYQYTNGISPMPSFPPVPGWITRGVPHEFEIPFVWGYTHVYHGPEELKNDTYNLHVPIACWSDEDVQLTEFMQLLWTNFAKFGNPTPEPIQHPMMSEPVTWERFDIENYNYFYMDNQEAGTRQAFRLREVALLNEYLFKKMRGKFMNDDEVQFVPYADTRSASASAHKSSHAKTHQKPPAPKTSLRFPDNSFARMFSEGMQGNTLAKVMTSEYGPVFELVKQVVEKEVKEGKISKSRPPTPQEIIQMIRDFLENIDDNICVQHVGYWYRDFIVNNMDTVIQFIRDLLEGIDLPTLPNIPTLPGGRTLPIQRPTLPGGITLRPPSN